MDIEGNRGAGEPDWTSRRDALKRGAIVGGLVWVAPALQPIRLSSAHAQASSNPKNLKGTGDPTANPNDLTGTGDLTSEPNDLTGTGDITSKPTDATGTGDLTTNRADPTHRTTTGDGPNRRGGGGSGDRIPVPRRIDTGAGGSAGGLGGASEERR